MKKKIKTEPVVPPQADSNPATVTKEHAVPSFTDVGVRALMAELAVARFARVIRSNVLSGKADGCSLTLLMPDANELDRLKQFAAQVASTERGACLDLAEAIVGKEQREVLAQAFVTRGPLGFQMRVEWTPETKIWMAK